MKCFNKDILQFRCLITDNSYEFQKLINDQRNALRDESGNVENKIESNKATFSDVTGKHRTSQAYISNARSQIENPQLDLSLLEEELQEMQAEVLQIQALLNNVLQQKVNLTKPFKTLILNGIVEVENGGNFGTVTTEKINGELASEVLGDIVR